MPKKQPCQKRTHEGTLCGRPKFGKKQSCGWHWLLDQPIELQVQAAMWRLEQTVEGSRLDRVPQASWPAGERFCSGCQTYVPFFYCQGSRCLACSSRANHRGHIERTYGLDQATYDRLLRWQGGRCFICGKYPRGRRRLAVDHDHATGAVRGLLCANDEWGCNRAVLGVVRDLATAQRLVAYYEQHPLARMLAGEPPVA